MLYLVHLNAGVASMGTRVYCVCVHAGETVQRSPKAFRSVSQSHGCSVFAGLHVLNNSYIGVQAIEGVEGGREGGGGERGGGGGGGGVRGEGVLREGGGRGGGRGEGVERDRRREREGSKCSLAGSLAELLIG